jgi:hypothetical protein
MKVSQRIRGVTPLPVHRVLLLSNPVSRSFVSRLFQIRRERRPADGLERFRSTHLEYAHNYIVKQSRAEDHNPAHVGTDGGVVLFP